jgi:hypothetical protein
VIAQDQDPRYRLAQEAKERAEKATPGPWSYAHTGEKDNGWAVGYAEWPDETPVSPDEGDLEDQETVRYLAAGEPDDIESTQATIVESVCFSATDMGNLDDAGFIAHARSDVPALADALIEVLGEKDHWAKKAHEATVRMRHEAEDAWRRHNAIQVLRDDAEAELERLKAENDRLQKHHAEMLEVLRKYHEWLEEHDRLTAPERPGAPRRGYIGLDHKIGENVEGCDGCAAINNAGGGE